MVEKLRESSWQYVGSGSIGGSFVVGAELGRLDFISPSGSNVNLFYVQASGGIGIDIGISATVSGDDLAGAIYMTDNFQKVDFATDDFIGAVITCSASAGAGLGFDIGPYSTTGGGLNAMMMAFGIPGDRVADEIFGTAIEGLLFGSNPILSEMAQKGYTNLIQTMSALLTDEATAEQMAKRIVEKINSIARYTKGYIYNAGKSNGLQIGGGLNFGLGYIYATESDIPNIEYELIFDDKETTTLPVHMTQNDTTVSFTISSDILFRFDKHKLTRKAGKALMRIYEKIIELRPRKVRILGHTDSIGEVHYNFDLSRKRAEAVKTFLLTLGVGQFAEVTSDGVGPAFPAADNQLPGGKDNPSGRRRNRRVVVTLQR